MFVSRAGPLSAAKAHQSCQFRCKRKATWLPLSVQYNSWCNAKSEDTHTHLECFEWICKLRQITCWKFGRSEIKILQRSWARTWTLCGDLCG